MASKLFKSQLMQSLKNVRLQAQRNGSHGHHLTPLEIDIANNNTYNHLPTPKGSWKELNDKRQQVNNMTLIVGFGIFISALFGTASMWEDAYSSPPVHKIRKDFPGSKFVD